MPAARTSNGAALVIREFFRQPFQFVDRIADIDLAYSLILDQPFQVCPAVNACQHRKSVLNVRHELSRNIMGLVIRMKRYQADVTLREQARNFRRVDLTEKQHVVQFARRFFRLELCEFGAAAHEQKADIVAMPQALDQFDENVHALGNAHVADVDEYLAAGQRGLPDRDAASDIGGNRQPVMQHLDTPVRRCPVRQIGEIGRRLHPDDLGNGVLKCRDRLEHQINRAFADQARSTAHSGKMSRRIR